MTGRSEGCTLPHWGEGEGGAVILEMLKIRVWDWEEYYEILIAVKVLGISSRYSLGGFILEIKFCSLCIKTRNYHIVHLR